MYPVRRPGRHLVNAWPKSDLLLIGPVGIDGGDLLVAVGVNKIERDPIAVGSPIREKARHKRQLLYITAIRISRIKVEIADIRIAAAERDPPVLAGEGGQGRNRCQRQEHDLHAMTEECF